VNRPGDASFGHFITPRQFRNEFGPTPAAVTAVQGVLRAEGFKVSAPSANGLIMPVTASVAAVRKALHVDMEAYELAGGANGWAATTAPELQVSIAKDVTAVLGLDNLFGPHDFMERPPAATGTAAGASATAQMGTPTNGGPQACKAAAKGAAAYNGWTFNQLAAGYGLQGLYSHGAFGQSETVAIFELEPFLRSNIDTFDTCYFGPAKAAEMLGNLSVVSVNGGIPTGSGSGEATLDVEDISALAPHATINVYEAPSADIGTQYATDDVYNAMVNADTANVISTSWGLCEPAYEIASPGAQEVENSIFEEAAAQGQSVFAAAGDAGSNDCAIGTKPTSPPVSVDDPASQPFVIGAGGTTLESDSQPPIEKVWNDGPSGGGGGGGISTTWPSPAWQADSGVAGVSNTYSQSAAYAFCIPPSERHNGSASAPCREVPDVTIDADEYTGTSFYQANGGRWSTVGGTSTAAPMWAAITTDIASSNSCADLAINPKNQHRDLGFVAPALYEAEADSAPGTDFNDITKGNNDIFNLGDGYPATPGYDLASGLGSPIVTSPGSGKPRGGIGTDTGLSASLCQLLTPAKTQPRITSLSPDHGSVKGGNTVVVGGKRFVGSGVSVESVDFGPTPARSFTVEANGTISVTAPASAPKPGTGSQTARTPGPVDVTVTIDTPSGVTTTRPSPTTSLYIYLAGSSDSPRPSVSGVGPSGGPVAGGNTVDVYGSDFRAGTGVSGVTFGGVRASKVTFIADYELQVTVPAESGATACATGKGFDPANTCQVQVVVTGANGSSATSTILAPYTGNMRPNDEYIVVPRPGTEIDPAPTEYDYAPTPVITSVTPDPYNESKPTAITIKGTGFNVLTLDWVNIGVPALWKDNDASFSTLSADKITLVPYLPSAGAGTKKLPGGISVFGLAGLSNVVPFSYTP
jgi:hypothetical protein